MVRNTAYVKDQERLKNTCLQWLDILVCRTLVEGHYYATANPILISGGQGGWKPAHMNRDVLPS